MSPADGSASSSTSVTLSWKDNGDPDNKPNPYRDFSIIVYRQGQSQPIVQQEWFREPSFTLTNLAAGTYTWKVRSGDGGTSSDFTNIWSFTVDTVAPTGSFTLNHGWATASSVSMPLDLTATDQHSGVQDVRVGSTCDSLGAWQPFQPRIWWQAVGQHGDTARVCVQFRDRAGNLSQTVEQSTRLDFYPAQPSSASYRLRSDVSAISGESHQSGNYRLNSTAGQTIASGSYATSTGYRAALGFWPRFFFTPATFTISGRVTDANGNGLGGVIISDGTRLANTTSSGDYTISDVPAGSYTLTPSKDGFSFSPTSLSVTVNGDLTGQNFTATLLTFTISGRVTDANGNGLGSVTISDGTRLANTTSSGDYTISDVPVGSYTLTPSKDGFSFSPTSLSVTVNGDLTGQNFTGTLIPPATYSISGRVTDANGNGLSDVTISDGTRLAHTTSSGDYTISGVPAGSYTLTPSKDGFSFSPTSLSVTVSGDLTGQN
ncbi:collagen binding domain-containing protein, partial [Candidatus Chloroploca sp. Khr17]|uniref:MSCRAMM family protein n=1 Tax=Candidatus Chloroploca sp. Khr17 TaxID=2496869 RepID=UPI001F11821F